MIVRLNTKDEFELRGGFPKTAEELFQYQAVIVADLEAEFFTHDQQALLQRFVSERGGGFLMLGGAESFREGGYAGTPIAAMLPVYLDRAADAALPSKWKLTLTREGWLQPWTRLRATEADEKTRLAVMQPHEVLNPVSGIKPGASVLATVSDPSGKTYPALVGAAIRPGPHGGADGRRPVARRLARRDDAKRPGQKLAANGSLAGFRCAGEHCRVRRTRRRTAIRRTSA